MKDFSGNYNRVLNEVIKEITLALKSVDLEKLELLADEILKAERVFVTGVGRVLLSLEAFAKRLSHLGIKSCYVGDIAEPAITSKDLLIVASGSGCSIVPLAIAKKAKEFGAKIVHIGSNQNSEMRNYADYMVRVPVRTRLYLQDEIDSCQIMTSLFEQVLLILGDIIAKLIVEDQKLDLKSLWRYHANLE